MVELSVVIPSYGGGPRLGWVIRELRALLAAEYGTAAEIVVVDDGSPTPVSIEPVAGAPCVEGGVSGALAPVRLVRLRRNCGQQVATWTGLLAAGGRYLVTMDDDGAHPVRVIIALVERLRAGAQLVYAVPTSGTERAAARRLGSWMNNLLFRSAFRVPRGVWIGSFRACTAELVARARANHGRAPFVYVSAMLLACRPRVAAVRYRRAPVVAGVASARPPSRYSYARLARTWWRIAWFWGPLRVLNRARACAHADGGGGRMVEMVTQCNA